MSYINIDFKLTPMLEEQVKQEVLNAFHKHILNNPVEFKKLVQSCVSGQIKSQINEILQDKVYKIFMQNKIREQLGMEDKNDN